MRVPFIPETVFKKRQSVSEGRKFERSAEMRKLEREIELEMEDEYTLDLKSIFNF